MRKKWFYRLLFSYTPIFFVTISILIFLFYYDINRGSKKQLLKTNQIYAEQAIHTLDATLSSLENLVIRELAQDKSLNLLYNKGDAEFNVFEQYTMVNKLDEIKRWNDWIDSIYLYNKPRGIVLSSSGILPINNFSDKLFIESMYPVGNSKWSDPRIFENNMPESQKSYVVTLTKSAPIISRKEGLMIVNVKLNKIVDMLQDISNSEINYLDLIDRDGRSFLQYDGLPLPGMALQRDAGSYSTRVQSGYTEWYVVTGLNKGTFAGTFFMISRLWMLIGAAIIFAGLVWLTYVTHRNYKPISSILQNIAQFNSSKQSHSASSGRRDDMSIIQSTLLKLMNATDEHEKQQKNDLQMKQKYFLMEVLEGTRPIRDEEWIVQTEGLEIAYLQLPSIVIIEIDRYIDFTNNFTLHDQYLFKYIVSNVLEDLTRSREGSLWCNWVEPNRMVALLSHKEAVSSMEWSQGLIDGVRSWVQDHVDFTISAAIGPLVDGPEELSFAYQEAVHLLQFKASVGSNRVITAADIPQASQGEIYEYLQRVRGIALQFRLANPDWSRHLDTIFDQISDTYITRGEICNLLNYFTYHLQKEISELGEALQQYWKEVFMQRFYQLAEHVETVQEAHVGLKQLLVNLENGLQNIREDRSSHELIRQIKDFIEEHFTNPNLSLDMLSQTFSISTRYISRLFKEEYGDSFVGYVTNLRIDKAKELLERTDESLQDIVEKVGYLNASSFIRIFRKAAGMTPGDYRKMKAKLKL